MARTESGVGGMPHGWRTDQPVVSSQPGIAQRPLRSLGPFPALCDHFIFGDMRFLRAAT